MRKTQLKRYAKLLAKVGLNVKKGQTVFIGADLDQPEFVAMVVEECYTYRLVCTCGSYRRRPTGLFFKNGRREYFLGNERKSGHNTLWQRT